MEDVDRQVQNFYTTECSKLEQPTVALLSSVQSLIGSLELKHTQLQHQLALHTQISAAITPEQIQQLLAAQETIRQNQQMLNIIQVCRNIDLGLVHFEESIQINGNDLIERLRGRMGVFRELYYLLEEVEGEFVAAGQQQQARQSLQQMEQLKTKYLLELDGKLYRAIIEAYYSPQRLTQLQSSLECLGLPIKRTQKQQASQSPPLLPQHTDPIIEALLNQYCYYCLHKKINMQIGSPSVINYSSPFFMRLWHKVIKSATYIFMNSSNMSQQGNAYKLDEPNWLFQYLGKIFRDNYYFITSEVMKVVRGQGENRDIVQSIQTYFVSYNLKEYFLKLVMQRLQSDISLLREYKDSKRVGFIIFNFLDELHLLEQQIYDTYNFEANFIETVLLWGEGEGSFNLLSSNFDYEHEWIEERIFSDFYNINYSNIGDLRNVEAYNITVNFTHIFEKLYSKFRRITHDQLKLKINQFYYEELLKLVRHIKTSFERIYNNSGIDKFEILISYKKVQDEFRGYFESFIQQSSVMENKIRDEYYATREHYVSVYALEELTEVHKKMYKKLADCNEYFAGQVAQLDRREEIKKKWVAMFRLWEEKVAKIRRILAQYEDKKIRNIFFVFLESIQFSEDGYSFFMSMFEPFLIGIFSAEGTKLIKVLIQMQKGTFKEYVKTHQNSLWFLNSNEVKSIEKAKIKDE